MKSDENYPYFIKALKYFIPDDPRSGAQKELVGKSGLSQSLISMILSGKKHGERLSHTRISEALGYGYNEFISIGRSLHETGEMPMVKDAVPHPIIIQVHTEPDKEFMSGIIDRYQAIPLYESGRLAAGARGCEFDPHETPASMVVVYKPELQGCSRHNLAALKVGGNSMEPTIYKGAIVVVDLDDKEFADRKIFIVKTDEMIASVKRVGKWKCGFILISDNAKYEIEPTDLDWYQLCVGRVVWQWKDMREG